MVSVTPPINDDSGSLSQNSSFTFTFKSSTDYELYRLSSSSCSTPLSPGQASFHPLSDLRSPTSTPLRSPASSPEHGDVENPLDVPMHDPLSTTVISTSEGSIQSDRENLDFAAEDSPTTKIPRGRGTFKFGNLLNGSWIHPPLGSETVPLPSTNTIIFKLWKWEIFTCVLAIGVLGSIYGILQRYDGQRIPDWGTIINLSTLIALIATLLRTLLAFVMAQIIGQAKWKYFSGDGRPTDDLPMRRLIETSRFNDASQGSIGALRLLPTIIRDPSTLLAAMIMIISLGTGSFVQQAIQTRPCQFPMDSVNASIPVSRNLTASKGGGSSVFGPLDAPNMLAALSSALSPDSEETGSPVSVGCPTGNCTFHNTIGGLYSSLGVCSSCVDISSLITSTGWALTKQEYSETYDPCRGYYVVTSAKTRFLANYMLPNGISVQTSFDNVTSSNLQGTELLVSTSFELGWVGDLASSEMKALSQWAFANVTILTSDWLPTSSGYTDYIAATCTLYPCLRSYNASVTSGKLEEILVSTVPAVPNVAAVFPPNVTDENIQRRISGDDWYPSIYSTKPGAHFQAVQSPCLVNDTVWTKTNQSTTLNQQQLLLLHAVPDFNGARRFTVENVTAPVECIYGMDIVAESDFSSFMTDTIFNGSCSGWSNGAEGTMQIDCGQKYWLSRFYEDGGITVDSIIKRLESFTDRLSNKMRMGLLNNPETVYGQVLQATVCSKIQYSWLTFPAVLVAVTSGLLAWTIFQSSRLRGREMVWKTSILPFLFYSDRFVVHNGEDMSASSTESTQRNRNQEPLLDLDRMEAEAKQQVVRFDVFK